MNSALSHLAVLLDFDGPVCSVFSRYRAPDVAADLLAFAFSLPSASQGQLKASTDPMEVVRGAALNGVAAREIRALDERLTELEMKAVAGAAPTEDGHAFVLQIVKERIPLAVVSNNATEAVQAYWARHRLPAVPIFGRPSGDPRLMKPNPYLLSLACRELGVSADRAALVGDSLTDVEAAQAAGARSVGYANKPGKRDALERAGADEVVERMGDVRNALWNLTLRFGG